MLKYLWQCHGLFVTEILFAVTPIIKSPKGLRKAALEIIFYYHYLKKKKMEALYTYIFPFKTLEFVMKRGAEQRGDSIQTYSQNEFIQEEK